MSDSSTCVEIAKRFYRHLDKGEFVQLNALMSADGVYFRPGNRRVQAGQSLIDDLGSRSKTVNMVHLLTNLFADVSGNNATVHGYMTVFISDDGKAYTGPAPAPIPSPKTIYDLDIQLTKQGAEWRIVKVQNVVKFTAA